jgi:hypothetical protein
MVKKSFVQTLIMLMNVIIMLMNVIIIKLKKKLELSLYYQSDREAKEDSLNGKTELEKAKILLQHHLKKIEKLEALEKKRKQIENKNKEVNMNDGPHLHPVIIDQPESTSCSSSDINSTNTLLIIDPTSSPVIPAPSSNNTTITVRSSNGKPLPETINSNLDGGIWTKVPKEKIKRKRDEIKLSSKPSIIYTLEP